MVLIFRSLPAVALALILVSPPGALGGPEGGGLPWWVVTGLDGDGDGVDDALTGAEGRIRVLVDYAAPPSQGERDALASLGVRILREIRTVPVLVVEAPAGGLPEIARAPGVVLVEEDSPLRPLLDESRGLVRADAVEDRHGLTGKGVTIAVFDSGIDTTHPDLRDGKVVASYDATSPVPLPRRILGEQVPVRPAITNGHGTHVAGIAAGEGTRSEGRYRGMAPGAAVADVRVFNEEGDGSSSAVLSGIDWVLANRDAYGIRVMVMSLGGRPTDGTDALSRAVDVATTRGVLTVASAGNQGPGEKTVGIPGVAARALTVGAVDKSLGVAGFSSRGPTPDGREKPEITAPGVDVTSAVPPATAEGEFYEPASGTSMAAPHVAGVAALVLEANASLHASLAKWVIVAASRAIGPAPHVWHEAYGFGFVDAEAAVRAAREPGLLGEPPYVETARNVPPDAGVEPLVQLEFEAGRAQRSMPAVGLAVGLVLAVVALARRVRE